MDERRNRFTFYPLLCLLVLTTIVLIVSFPGKRLLRDILPPITCFDDFFQRNALYMNARSPYADAEGGALLRAILEGPSEGGKRLDRIVSAACEEEAILGPVMRTFIEEWGEVDPGPRAGPDTGAAEAFLCDPPAVRYGGTRSLEIQRLSRENWKRFAPRLRTWICLLYAASLPAAREFQTIRLKAGKGASAVPVPSIAGGIDPPASLARGMGMAVPADLSRAWRGIEDYCGAADAVLYEAVEFAPSEYPAIPGDEWFPSGVLYAAQSPFGLVVVGGTGDTVYPAGDLFLLVDLGGRDTYFFDETLLAADAGGVASSCSTVLDISGNDLYTGGTARVAAGLLGFRSILDIKGSDRYEAEDTGLGAGCMGAGFLVDLSGDDLYTMRSFGLGAGVYGPGVFFDGGGDDCCRGSGYCQGFAGPGGLGLLVDDAGDDIYVCLPPPGSRSSEGGEDCCFSQGAAVELLPGRGAGLGLLLDLSGDDAYRSGSSSQGHARGKGVAVLLDCGGYDFYNGRDQCQGYGCSGGVGLVRDLQGNDHFLARDRSQGVGEAGSLGFLIDDGGDDHYTAMKGSQGKNQRDGTGMLHDLKGRDRFFSEALR